MKIKLSESIIDQVRRHFAFDPNFDCSGCFMCAYITHEIAKQICIDDFGNLCHDVTQCNVCWRDLPLDRPPAV